MENSKGSFKKFSLIPSRGDTRDFVLVKKGECSFRVGLDSSSSPFRKREIERDLSILLDSDFRRNGQ